MGATVRLGLLALLALTFIAGGSACAMSPQPPKAIGCKVGSAELLAGEVGGEEAVCAEIVRSLAAAAQRPERVEITILGPSRASARIVTAQGLALPEVHVGRSDRPLGRSSFRSLGSALAAQLAEAESSNG